VLATPADASLSFAIATAAVPITASAPSVKTLILNGVTREHIVASATPLAAAEKYLPQNLSALGRGICGYFFLLLSFSRSEVVMKKSSNDTFFLFKEVLGGKIII